MNTVDPAASDVGRAPGPPDVSSNAAREDATHARADEPAPFDRSRALTIATAITLTALYALCGARTIWGGDSGELGAAAVNLGVPHPPGYPLYTLLGHAFVALPIGAPLTRLVALSALAMGVAVALTLRATLTLGVRMGPALVALAPLALAPLTVRLAGIPEVFALHALCVAALLLACCEPVRSGVLSLRRALLLGMLSGLGASNHHTIILVAPLPLYALWCTRSSGWRPWTARIAVGMAGSLLGLLPYASTILRGSAPVWPRWGETSTLDGFLTHFLRRDYGTFSLGLLSASGETPHHGLAHLARTLRDLGPAIGLAALGAIALWRQPRSPVRAFVGVILGTWMLAGPGLHGRFNLPVGALSAEITGRFDLQPFFLLSVVAAFGASWLLDRLRDVTLRTGATVAWLCFALAVGAARLPDAAPRRHVVAERYGRDLLAHLPPRAVLLIDGDAEMSVLTWLQEVEGVRGDILLVHLGLLGHRWYVHELRRRAGDLDLPFTPGLARSREIVDSAHRVGRFVLGSLSVAGRLSRRWTVVPFGLAVLTLAPGG